MRTTRTACGTAWELAYQLCQYCLTEKDFRLNLDLNKLLEDTIERCPVKIEDDETTRKTVLSAAMIFQANYKRIVLMFPDDWIEETLSININNTNN